MSSSQTYTSIAKENVTGLPFVKTDVLVADVQAMQRRKELLQRAVVLGNAHHHKVKILFDTAEGTTCVETTIWHATDLQVVLKGGVTIPVRCIREVIL